MHQLTISKHKETYYYQSPDRHPGIREINPVSLMQIPGKNNVQGEFGSYQGKRDTLPWDNAPPTAEWRGGQWTKGDRASWETNIKQRQLAQHEHKRIYQ